MHCHSAQTRIAILQRQLLVPSIVAAQAKVPLAYGDDYIKGILNEVRVIALVGASSQSNRPSYSVMKYMQDKGYRVIPVNPVAKGQTILGEHVYGDLAEIPEGTAMDMVDVFRNSEAAGEIADQAIAMKASRGISVLWLQLDVINHAAAERAAAAGLRVVMDRCPRIEYERLCTGR